MKGRESYYIDAVLEGEPPGRWSGALAERLGLVGEVAEADLARLLGRFEAPDGTRLGSAPRAFRTVDARVQEFVDAHPEALPEDVDAVRTRAEDEHRSSKVAYDLTLSVPKSISVLHTALWRLELDCERSGDEDRAEQARTLRSGIESAVWTANAAAMEAMTGEARTRAGAHGRTGSAGRWVPVDGLIIASFFQHTSRSIDPHLHVHNVVFARAQDIEGEIRAIDSADLRDGRKQYSAVGDRVLAEELNALGVPMALRPDGLAWEVLGIGEDMIELFSERASAVTERMRATVAEAEAARGRPLTPLEINRLQRQASLSTRAAKSHDGETAVERLDRVQAKIREQLGTGLGPIAERALATQAVGPPVVGGVLDRAAVISMGIAAAADRSAGWRRPELVLELERALPLTGGSPTQVVALLESLADEALVSDGVVQVAGVDRWETPADLVMDGVTFVRPSARRWAAPGTLHAEDLIRMAAVERGGHGLDRAAVGAWLDTNRPTITSDQRAVVEGVAGTDARLVQVVAPAGTGKSYAAGALAGAWEELSGGGRVVGLAVAEIAAATLREDGVRVTRNLAAWLAGQDRLAEGRGLPADEEIRVRARDVLLVDEASMVATADLDRVRSHAAAAGARIVLTGDPRQLAAVEAGGALSLLEDGRAETYTLSEARRFDADWERQASIRLRDGDVTALGDYQAHGRIVSAPDVDGAVREAGRRIAADLIEGRESLGIAGSNALAARLATAVRDALVDAGQVEAGGLHLPLDGTTAAVGDRVMTRQIDRTVGVLNRQRWTVAAISDDGGMQVVDAAGEVRDLPSAYVAASVQSGYAGTAHAVQGLTVDRAVTVQDGTGDLAGLYVAGTRGRQSNTFVVPLRREDSADAAGPAAGQVDAPTGRSVLSALFKAEADNAAARVQQERNAAWNQSMSTILGKLEADTHAATLRRLGDDLDQLAAEGVLPERQHAALAADQSRAHLARVLRAAEQSGADVLEVLRAAVSARELDSAVSVAQVLGDRIEKAGHVSETPSRVVPSRLPAEHAAHLAALTDAADARCWELGAQAAEAPPEWAVAALGPVPTDAVDRLEWERAAGRVAGSREAVGWRHPDVALPAPGRRTDTERRALHLEAWDALGRPAAQRDDAGLSDGRLRARVAAWEREQAWAPPSADAAMEAAHLGVGAARPAAVLADAAGDTAEAAALRGHADRLERVADRASATVEARGQWAIDTSWTRLVAENAAEELTRRGLASGADPDRVTAEQWWAAEAAARTADDAHRDVTDADLVEDAVTDDPHAGTPAAAPVEEPTGRQPGARSPSRATARVPVAPSEVELDAAVAAATVARRIAADRASAQAAQAASGLDDYGDQWDARDVWGAADQPPTAGED